MNSNQNIQNEENDILKNMLSYSNLRRLKCMEYQCSIYDCLYCQSDDTMLDERDPDEEAFLSEEEKRQMYG